jgi:hypothetical protein
MHLVVTKELVSRHMKSTVLSVVTCASSWVGEKEGRRQGDQEQTAGRRNSEPKDRTKNKFTSGFKKLPVLRCSQ